MKKTLGLIIILFLSSYIMQSALPAKGLSGLVGGVDIKNNITLLSSDFSFAAMIILQNFGRTEGFLFGIGKYQLIRYKSRNALLLKIIINAFAITGFLCFLRIVIYALILTLKGRCVFDLPCRDIMLYLLFGVCSFFIISLMQISLELSTGSFAGVVICMSYYIITVVISGVLLENGKTFITTLLITNYPMRFRTKIMYDAGIHIYSMLLTIAAVVFLLAALCKKSINRKDIF